MRILIFVVLLCLEPDAIGVLGRTIEFPTTKLPVFAQNVQENAPPSSRLKHRTPIMFARSMKEEIDVADACDNSGEDFPHIFTPQQRKRGAVIVAFLVGIYCFTLLALICDNYFLPCVERICEVFDISEDVGAATFMSVATSAPELFVNIIGTFVTESDIGIGTVVGSSLFNTLGVASLGGLFASTPIKIDWWPVTRDITIYVISIIILVLLTWDSIIYWYEGLTLFVIYFVYFMFMFQNKRITKLVRKYVLKEEKDKEILEASTSNSLNSSTSGSNMEKSDAKKADNSEDDEPGIFSIPNGKWTSKLFFCYCWPIRLILFCTVPDPKKHSKLFPLTFVMCIILIGTNSYIVSWMITIIGRTFGISDAVLGLTFLAAGGCLPEAISITIMSRKGMGSMGVSNALGANTMNILLSLGMPWFIRTIVIGTTDNAFLKIESGSIEYTILALIAVAFCLYITLYLNKFTLSRMTGVILLTMYIIWVVLAILSELVFFDQPVCTN